jgi:hypothetical protein
LRNSIKHIAILLTVVFTVTLLPFNALHQHHEEEHAAAMLSHEADHSCELDERFCQETFTRDCDHGSHIGTTHVKCFSCQFHFIKTFVSAGAHETTTFTATSHEYFIPATILVLAEVKNIQNKGPPTC